MTGAASAAGFCGRPGLVLRGDALELGAAAARCGETGELAAEAAPVVRGVGTGERTGGAGELAVGTGGIAGTSGLAVGTGRHVWLHGDRPVHEFHAGVGTFVADGLRGAAVSTALTRSSVRTIAAMGPWLAERGVAGWRVVVVRGVIDGVTPRLAVALPYALQAIALAGRHGLAGWVFGAPHCLLGPFRGAALGSPPRAYAAVCAGCPARTECPGVDAAYLARFGAEEVSPRALRAAGEAPRAGRELFDA